jgi:hypothetical protein
MTGRDKMPFGKYGPKREGGALTLDQIKLENPGYFDWLMTQDGFATKNASLAKWILEGDSAAPKIEKDNLVAEEVLLRDASPAFKSWWTRAYGERLRTQGEMLYIGHLRVALNAWKEATTVRYTDTPSTPPSPTTRPAPRTEVEAGGNDDQSEEEYTPEF